MFKSQLSLKMIQGIFSGRLLLPLGEGVTQGIECMEGSAMYFMSTFEEPIKYIFQKSESRIGDMRKSKRI